MLGGAGYSIEDAVEAYALWWREAGFHTAVRDTARDWRESAAAPEAPRVPSARPGGAAPVRQAPLAAPPLASSSFPETLPAFLDWLGRDEAQPEAHWSGPRFLPSARTAAPLLLVLDMPGAAPIDATIPLDAAQQRFLAAMLAAIGRTPDDIAFASMAMRRPAGGLIDDAHLALLGARMRHYLALARPGVAILIGDRTSRALLEPSAAPQAGRLPQVNHPGGTLPAIAMPALDLLMNRPAIKARSWQTLRLLNGVLH